MAVPPLRALVAAGWDVPWSSPAPTPAGGGGATSPSPVKAAALELGLAGRHGVDDVLDAGADLGVVVAFGRMIRPHVLAALAMVNLHFSLLPRWRGAAPGRAGAAGRRRRDRRVHDGGRGGARHRAACSPAGVPIGPRRRPPSCAPAGRGREPSCSSTPCRGRCRTPTPQEGEATYAAKLDPADLEMDWAPPAERARPLGACRRRVDDVPRPAAQGPRRRAGRRRAAAARRRSPGPVGAGRGALRLSPSSPKARPRCRGAPSPTAPTPPTANSSAPIER